MSQDTPLHVAAFKGDLEACKRLVAEGADIHARSYMDYTPFHEAAQGGHKEVIQLFLENGGDVNVRDATQNMPIHDAAKAGHASVCELLVKAGCDVESRGFEQRTPLHHAAMNGQVEVATTLIDLGANVNSDVSFPGDYEKVTPLHMAARVWDHNQVGNEDRQTLVARKLLKAGADPNAMMRQAEIGFEKQLNPLPSVAAIHFAHSAGMVHALMDYGADPDLHSVNLVKLNPIDAPVDRGTPCALKVHAQQGRAEVVEALVERGASLETKDAFGKTARDHIRVAGMHNALAKEEAMKRVPLLEAAWASTQPTKENLVAAQSTQAPALTTGRRPRF